MTDPTLASIAYSLERIASALERAYPLDLRDSGLTRAWDDAEIARDPNRCEPGCIRPSLHGGDCDVRVVADPLDESDHRPRHDRIGEHIYRHGPSHWHYYRPEVWTCREDSAPLAYYNDLTGPLASCDCPDPMVTEAENRAGD